MLDHILELINQKNLIEARSSLDEFHTADIADFLEELEQRDLIRVFRVLSKDQAAAVFTYISTDFKKKLIESMSNREISDIMDDLFLDDTIDMIEEMPANVVKRLLNNTDAETRGIINSFLQYPKDSAGSIMTIEFVDLKKDMTVRESFDHIRQTGVDKETVYTCYVTDDYRKLIGVVSIKAMLLSNPGDRIETIMDHPFIFIQTHDDQEEVAHIFDRYDLLAVPVVDHEMLLVGIITVDDVLDVIEEENTEDFEKMAAMLPSHLSYLETNVLIHSKRRLPWLLFLMISATFTGLIITHFENAIAVMPALVSFIPMLMDTGGNSGSQSATLIIRGLALERIRPDDGLKVIRKEIHVAVIVGAILAVINILRITLINQSFTLALTVGLSLYATVVLAKLAGCLLPIAASKIKLDPAIMATPVISTLVDALSLIIYFMIARSILHI